jgi:hypothetical protein
MQWRFVIQFPGLESGRPSFGEHGGSRIGSIRDRILMDAELTGSGRFAVRPRRRRIAAGRWIRLELPR